MPSAEDIVVPDQELLVPEGTVSENGEQPQQEVDGLFIQVASQPDGSVSVLPPQVLGSIRPTEALDILELAISAHRQRAGYNVR